MQVQFSFVSTLPDPAAFARLLQGYYGPILEQLLAAGGPELSAEDMVTDTMAHIDDLLPPDGRTLLATGTNGELVGCGVIRKIRPDAAELKRMFVTPEARGLGLGRTLFEMRIEEARRMGCHTLYADTVKGNTGMTAMYEKFGFTYIPRYPENANPPELEPYLVYLKHEIT